MELTKGQILNNTYRLIKRIGSGGFSVVWVAQIIRERHVESVENAKNKGNEVNDANDANDANETNIDNQDLCAIKIYAPQQGLNPDDIALFEDEDKLLSQMAHPNIIQRLDYFMLGESPCLVLKYCPNGSLHSKIKKEKKLSELEVAKLVSHIGSALHYLNTLPTPIYHLDLKPENILIDEAGDYILTDFGISNEVRSTMLRKSNVVAETFVYRSPERALNHNLSDKHDIFSFGVVLMEACNGLFDAKYSLADSVLNGYELPKIEDYTKRLTQLIYATVELDPQDRPTALELKEAGTHFIEKKFWIIPPSVKSVSERPKSSGNGYRQRISEGIQQEEQDKKEHDRYFWLVIAFAIMALGVIGFGANKIFAEKSTPVVETKVNECDALTKLLDDAFSKGRFTRFNNLSTVYANTNCNNTNEMKNKITVSNKCLSLLNRGNDFFDAKKYKDAQNEYNQYKQYQYQDCKCPSDSLGHIDVRLTLIEGKIKNNNIINKIDEVSKIKY